VDARHKSPECGVGPGRGEEKDQPKDKVRGKHHDMAMVGDDHSNRIEAATLVSTLRRLSNRMIGRTRKTE